MKERTYIAIDLKSFYASVECAERGLDPLTTNLVVADTSRTAKTICLAVSPSLKAYGIPGRARLFEVERKVREVNIERRQKIQKREFTGESTDERELAENPELELQYIAATPRMALYIEYSVRIYRIYLKYVAPEDIHGMTAKKLAEKMIRDVLEQTGITATAGIGTNLYLCKIAMDIMAKRVQPDKNGVRIASLDELSYRKQLWDHRPLTDFWRVGRGYMKKLEENGLYTMGDIARCSVGTPEDFYNEDLLYRLFGVNAELLIDHAWGWEPCTMQEIKKYKPSANSLGSGQVLQCPYPYEKALLVVREMADQLALELVDKELVTDQVVLTVGYDIENLRNPSIRGRYHGEVKKDHYGRLVPKHAHGRANLPTATSSAKEILEAVTGLYEEIVNPLLFVRRISLTANKVVSEKDVTVGQSFEQLDLFTDYAALEVKKKEVQEERNREKSVQKAVLDIKKKYGKNAVLKGMSLIEGATAVARNRQIGGHKA